jgi:hypothetical protein
VIELPGGVVLKGKQGARQFAAKHAETGGRKQAVTLASLEPRARNRFVATLVMTNCEVATDELLYSMDVGSVIEVRDGLISRSESFLRPRRLLPRRSRLNAELPSGDAASRASRRCRFGRGSRS